MPSGPIYTWLILRDKVTNKSMMVGVVNKDGTVQAYQHYISHDERSVLLCSVDGLTLFLRLNGLSAGPHRSVCVLLPVSTSIPYP